MSRGLGSTPRDRIARKSTSSQMAPSKEITLWRAGEYSVHHFGMNQHEATAGRGFCVASVLGDSVAGQHIAEDGGACARGCFCLRTKLLEAYQHDIVAIFET